MAELDDRDLDFICAAAEATKTVSSCIAFCTLTPLWIWLTLYMVNQSSVSLSLEDFTIADVQTSNVSAPNQTFIYFKLHLENKKDVMSLDYGNLSLSFSYYRGSDDIVQLANYTIQKFHQGISKKTNQQTSVMLNPGISWREISKNATSVISRVDLAGVVRFSQLHYFKSKKRKIMAWAKVELDPVSGNRMSKKAVRLKHTIKHHPFIMYSSFFFFDHHRSVVHRQFEEFVFI
ncbi:hypothetical protein DCAR_0522399 [Daucus carota subsp. sativus]|uniref:Late embryogenesis abundant protein LEA-2 subgroup domain-containing protein n=1 Tax=Daucus carota subsp. sativus TaxID=79200 RepID=A0A162A700_DAUCS|nr:hypothetical protein DCAR_0522399 [Daucus carota subsp. sativus]